MRPAHRKSRPRHLAGSQRTPWQPRAIDGGIDADLDAHFDADFDVEAALDAETDFDFEGLFAGDDDLPSAAAPRVRFGRRRLAFAVSVTLAAIPLLVLDNFQATAEPSEGSKVEAAADQDEVAEVADLVTDPASVLADEVPPSPDVTLPKATVFVAQPTTTTTAAAPTTPTTERPAPTTTTTERPAPTTTVAAATAAVSRPDPDDDATWERLAQCEAGGNWQAVSEPRNGMTYYGGLQFSLSTWQGLGGTGLPSDAPKATQIAMGKKLQARQGWDAWPTCARSLGWS
jgi:hypothetical protein